MKCFWVGAWSQGSEARWWTPAPRSARTPGRARRAGSTSCVVRLVSRGTGGQRQGARRERVSRKSGSGREQWLWRVFTWPVVRLHWSHAWRDAARAFWANRRRYPAPVQAQPPRSPAGMARRRWCDWSERAPRDGAGSCGPPVCVLDEHGTKAPPRQRVRVSLHQPHHDGTSRLTMPSSATRYGRAAVRSCARSFSCPPINGLKTRGTVTVPSSSSQ